MSIPTGWWTNVSTHRKRVYSILAVLVVCVIVMGLGSLVPVDQQTAKQIDSQLNQTRETLSAQGNLTPYIFGNNFLICLLMFIPLIGPLAGLFILFSTGVAISAIATAEGYPSWLAFISLFLSPHSWLEFAAYATAMAAGVWLFWRFIKGRKRGFQELRVTCIFITICALLLALAAFVEVGLISLLGG